MRCVCGVNAAEFPLWIRGIRLIHGLIILLSIPPQPLAKFPAVSTCALSARHSYFDKPTSNGSCNRRRRQPSLNMLKIDHESRTMRPIQLMPEDSAGIAMAARGFEYAAVNFCLRRAHRVLPQDNAGGLHCRAVKNRPVLDMIWRPSL